MVTAQEAARSPKRMRVRVVLSVEIDPEAWEALYGTGATGQLLREDVRVYCEAQVYGSAAREEGAITHTRLATDPPPVQ